MDYILYLAKKVILPALVIFGLTFLLPIKSAYSKKYSKDELRAVYSQILCIKCGCKQTIDVCQCPMAPELRAKVKERLEQGFSPKEVIWNFNGDNIAFIHKLPQRVIRALDCPCACGETVEVCIGEMRAYLTPDGKSTQGCPIIEDIMADIRGLATEAKSDQETIDTIIGSELQTKYKFKNYVAIQKYEEQPKHQRLLKAAATLPDAILDDSECGCACTESLRTCLEQMPWCERIAGLMHAATLYQKMGLTTEEAAASLYAPCGKMCGKITTGTYLGINCASCSRPIRDKAYTAVVNGVEKKYCCESCYRMETELPDEILDNVICQVCDSGLTLREDICPSVNMQKMLIKTWLMEGKTPQQIIERFGKKGNHNGK